MTRKKILLTFDYELFFGNPSGTVDNCILKPTEKIINILKKYDKCATFFIDVMYLQKLYQYKDTKTIETIEKQLEKLISHGHHIELHLHPHWLDAVYEDEKWVFPTYKHYRLHTLEESDIVLLFKQSKGLLEQIARRIDSCYEVVAFRAGGWSIEPFLKLKKAFSESGIKIDSSTGYGMKLKGLAHQFDFTNIPKKKSYYFEESAIRENLEGSFLEVPITTYKTTILHKILRRIRRKKNPKLYAMIGDGKSVGGVRRNYLDEIFTYEMLSLESIEPQRLMYYVSKSSHDLVTLISHPKGMSEISFLSLEKLCSSEYQFISYKELL